MSELLNKSKLLEEIGKILEESGIDHYVSAQDKEEEKENKSPEDEQQEKESEAEKESEKEQQETPLTEAQQRQQDQQDQQQKQAMEQWLRKIPDEPSGLLRRKFRYERYTTVHGNRAALGKRLLHAGDQH